MKIPKRFKLFGHIIEVNITHDLSDKTDLRGCTKYREHKILLQAVDNKFYTRPTSNQEQTFYHELVHWILTLMSEDNNHDEKFVETFSMLLHQALTTMEYK